MASAGCKSVLRKVDTTTTFSGSSISCRLHAVRLRHDEGSDLAWEALRRWLQRPGSSPSKLLELAKRLKGAEVPLRTALEVLQ